MSFPENLFTDPGWLAFIVGAVLRVSLILGVAVIATRVLRRATARVRHAVLATAMVGVLAVPFLSQVLPGWGVALIPAIPATDTQSEALVVADSGVLTLSTRPKNTGEGPVIDVLHTHPSASSITVTRDAEGARVEFKGSTLHQHVGESPASESVGTSATISTDVVDAEPVATGSEWLPDTPFVAGQIGALKNWLTDVSALFWFLALWLVGLCFFLASLFTGMRRANGLAAESVPVVGDWLPMVDECQAEAGFSRAVDVRMTPTVTAPMTWGARRPIVLLPEAAEEWSEERRRVVLRHEFAHIQRNDWLFHTLSRIACAVYWLNPLAWIATRRLSIERERACDDAVISLGTKPSEYAKHLLDIAQSMTAMRGVPAVALTMARLSQLEGRIVDVLRHTGKANRRSAWAWSFGMAGLLIAVSVVEPSGSTEGAKEEAPIGYAFAPVAPLADLPTVHIVPPRPGRAPRVYGTAVVPRVGFVPLTPRTPVTPRTSVTPLAPVPNVQYYDLDSGGYLRIPTVPSPVIALPDVPLASAYSVHSGDSDYAFHFSCDHDEQDHESCNDVAGHLAGSSWVHTSDDHRGRYRLERDDDHMIFEMKNDEVDLYFETRGDVEFNDKGTEITKMGEHSKVVIESREGDDLFEIVIRPGDGDKLTYDWRVNDKKREFDEKGEEWLATALGIAHDHLAMSELAGAANVLAGEINAIFGERNALFGEANMLRGERNTLQGQINQILGERNELLGQMNVIYGDRNAARAYADALRLEHDAQEYEMNRLLGDRNHQVERLHIVESERHDLLQRRSEIEHRLQSGDDVTEDLDRSMLELIDEQLQELDEAASQIRENMDLRAVVIAGDDLAFGDEDRRDSDVDRQLQEVRERLAALDVEGHVESINDKILQEQIEERIAELLQRVDELNASDRVKDIKKKIKDLDVDDKVKDLEKDVKAKYKKLDQIQRDLI